MSHVRQQIRAAMATLLTGLTTTGARVHVNRARPIADAALPALVVRTRDENVDALTLNHPGVLVREMELEVEILASGASAADTIDTALAEVEVAVAGDATLAGLLKMPMQFRSVAAQYDDETSPPLAALSARFIATYSTLADAPETAI